MVRGEKCIEGSVGVAVASRGMCVEQVCPFLPMAATGCGDEGPQVRAVHAKQWTAGHLGQWVWL